MIIFITSSLPSKNGRLSFCTEKSERLRSNNLDLTTDQRFGHLLSSIWCFWCCACSFSRSPCGLLLDEKIFWIGGTSFGRMSHFYHHIPQVKSSDTVQTQTNIQWYHLWFCSTARHWCLLLAHRAYGNECSTPKDFHNSSRGRLWVFKVSSKIRILGQTHFVMLCSISHMAALSVITRVLNVSVQTSQVSATSSCSFFCLREQACLRTIRMSSLQMSAK